MRSVRYICSVRTSAREHYRIREGILPTKAKSSLRAEFQMKMRR
jgi:hypothetical protein